MVCSPEQLAANRRNSRLSSGPSSPEGRRISRKNSLKHGLTGAGVVIPDEDVEAVEERFEAFETDLKPANDVARFLTRRAALLSVRLDRSAREEAARITLDMFEAEEVEEDARAMEFEELTERFADHPAESARKLRRSEEGIDWLMDAWRMARRDLLERDGLRWRAETVLRLAALKPGTSRGSRILDLSLAAAGNFNGLDASDWPDLPPLERRGAAKAEIVASIDREIAGLEQSREALDRDRIARIRALATSRAIFDSDKGATLARKYEASTERTFFRTLEKIEAINSAAGEEAEVGPEVEAEIETEATTEEFETCDELASFFPDWEADRKRSDLLEVLNRIAARFPQGDEDEEGWEDQSGDDSLAQCPRPAPG